MDIPGEVSFNPVTAPPDEKSYVVVVWPRPIWLKQTNATIVKIVFKLKRCVIVVLKLLSGFIMNMYG